MFSDKTPTKMPVEKQTLSPESKLRDLNLQGKSMAYLRDFLVNNMNVDIAEVEDYINKLDKKQWSRLTALLRGDKPVDISFDPMWHDFSTFRCPEWSIPNQDIKKRSFLMDTYPDYIYLKVLRIQSTKICAAHADLVVTHIEKCIRSGDPTKNFPMPDLADALLKMYGRGDPERTNNFVTKYMDGCLQISCTNFLRSLFGIHDQHLETLHLVNPTTAAMMNRAKEDGADFLKRLHKRPALLSFEMSEELRRDGMYSYSGMPSCETRREDPKKRPMRHAMVVLGARMQSDGTYMYVCLNFWASKLFVEFSHEYLARSNGKLIWIREDVPVEELPVVGEPVRRFDGMAAETACEFASDGDEEQEDDNDDEEYY